MLNIMSTLQEKISSIIEEKIFRNFIILVIILNSIILGLETYDIIMQKFGSVLKVIDTIIITIFVIEISLKLFVHTHRFFFSLWNIFDFVIVLVSVIPLEFNLTALRLLRILRMLRLLSAIPSLRKVVEGLIRAIPGILSGALIILLFFYIFAVMGSHMFGKDFPEWFGGLGASMFTLFQIMTLESWAMGIVRPVLEIYPHAWLFFVSYILITTFTTLNLFIAIIVNAMHVDDNQNAINNSEKIKEELMQAIEASEKRVVNQIESQLLQQKNK